MNRRRLPYAVLAAVVIGAASLGACSAPPPAGPLVGSGVGGPFSLIDQDGHAVTDKTYAGRWRLMYFGYTFCPDVCPVDVQKIAQGMKVFTADDPARAAKIVPIFVTVDPERDTPAVLKTFVRAFSPTMVGLTGTPAQAEAARKAFRVYAKKAGTGPDYLVDHTAIIYLMDPANQPVSFLDHGATPQAIAAELKTYVR
ncbi:SCO family protein [Polymorphobacter sp. PAMC 29334]|uniref:SCO family protein n=1 Tax=Polymorphobacter sp. PAMC 29334 TaxID=2862331 RepID=UPI001C66DE0E|nr:SCO family protein [Polymorphobacter sp. PAMC 29334]QYE35735.1 SCO family protein [Polymorphobacter sp. PAMC 29334]